MKVSFVILMRVSDRLIGLVSKSSIVVNVLNWTRLKADQKVKKMDGTVASATGKRLTYVFLCVFVSLTI